MKHTTVILGDARVAYTSDTVFLVQVGRGPKGSYSTRYRFVGDLHRAAFYYECINIGNGYKKRLLMPSARRPVLARQAS